MTSAKFRACLSGSLALWITGIVISKSSTYACPLTNELGSKIVLALGTLVCGIAAWLMGFVTGRRFN
jgi:hypothetical protein